MVRHPGWCGDKPAFSLKFMPAVSINAMSSPGTPSDTIQIKFLYVAVWQKMDWSRINEQP